MQPHSPSSPQATAHSARQQSKMKHNFLKMINWSLTLSLLFHHNYSSVQVKVRGQKNTLTSHANSELFFQCQSPNIMTSSRKRVSNYSLVNLQSWPWSSIAVLHLAFWQRHPSKPWLPYATWLQLIPSYLGSHIILYPLCIHTRGQRDHPNW